MRQLLDDMVEDVMLPAGDILFEDKEARPYLVEIKETGDLLSSITTGRLYDQLREMPDRAFVSYLVVQGLMEPWKDGRLKVDYGITKWRYTSVQGILTDIGLRGFIVRETKNPFATSLLVRTIYNTVNSTKSPISVRTPLKVVGFRDQDQPSVKMLCCVHGINRVLANRLFARYHTVERLAKTSIEDLMLVKGVNESKAKAIFDTFTEWVIPKGEL